MTPHRWLFFALALGLAPRTVEAACDGTGRGLRIMTFNTGLTGFFMDMEAPSYGGLSDEARAIMIAQKVRAADPDIVVFQEVWNDTSLYDLARDFLIANLEEKYPHWVTDGDGCYSPFDQLPPFTDAQVDSGLVVMSKWPFAVPDQSEPAAVGGFGDGGWGSTNSNVDRSDQARFLCFDDIRMPDAMADKGIMHVRVSGECGLRRINIFTAHSQASDSDDTTLNPDTCARCEEKEFQRKNLGDARFMIEKLVSSGERVNDYLIFAGDLNIRYDNVPNPAQPGDLGNYCEADTDGAKSCYTESHGPYGEPSHVDSTYNFMFDGFSLGGTTSAFEHNEFFSCNAGALASVSGDAGVCPANAGGAITSNVPFLVDSYKTEHPSTHTKRPGNDFILHNKPRFTSPLVGGVRSCMQHLREGRTFVGLSDHRPVIADFNDANPRCSPFPWQGLGSIPMALQPDDTVKDAPNNNGLTNVFGPEYVVWDVNDWMDVNRVFDGTPGGGDPATAITQAGSVQWYVIYQPAAWDIELSSSVQHDVYHQTDLTTPISHYGDCTNTGTLDGARNVIVKCKYQGYEPPYYIKVYGWDAAANKEDRTFAGGYRIKFHRRNCSSVADACPLFPSVEVPAVFPAGVPLGANDMAYFSFSTEQDVARNFPILGFELSHTRDDVMSSTFGPPATCPPPQCPGIPFEDGLRDAADTVDISSWVSMVPSDGTMSFDGSKWLSIHRPLPGDLPGDDRGNGSSLYQSNQNYYGFPKSYLYTVRRRSDEVGAIYMAKKIAIKVRYTTPLTYFKLHELTCHEERTDEPDPANGYQDDVALQFLVPGATEHFVSVAGASVTVPPVCQDPSHPQCAYLADSGACDSDHWYDHNFHRALQQSSISNATFNPIEDVEDEEHFNLGAQIIPSLLPEENRSVHTGHIGGEDDDWSYDVSFFRSHEFIEIGCIGDDGSNILGACDLAGYYGYAGSSGYECCAKGAGESRVGHCTDCVAAGFGVGCATPPPGTTCSP